MPHRPKTGIAIVQRDHADHADFGSALLKTRFDRRVGVRSSLGGLIHALPSQYYRCPVLPCHSAPHVAAEDDKPRLNANSAAVEAVDWSAR